MEDILVAILKGGELVFDFIETIYAKLFSDETGDDQQNQAEGNETR